jgi:hypothetical protein
MNMDPVTHRCAHRYSSGRKTTVPASTSEPVNGRATSLTTHPERTLPTGR